MAQTKHDLHGLKDVRVGGITYKVVRKALKKTKHATVMGQCDYQERVIRINNQLNNEECGFVLLHELIHAVVDAASCDTSDMDDENYIHPYSRLLWDALINAGLIDRKWLKK